MTDPMPPDYPDRARTGLCWRALTPADVEAWYALVRRMAEADQPVWSETREDLAEYLSSPANDPALTTVAGFDGAGTLRAAGRVSARPGSAVAHTWGGVDPAWRRRGIGRAVYRWQRDCQHRRFAAACISGGVLRTMAEERAQPHNALLRAAGAGVVRYFTEMTRPLSQPIPDLPLPAGFVFATLDPEDSEPVRLAHNEAFAGHWGSEPRDPARWDFTVRHPQLVPAWSMSVLDTTTGETVAYQLASFDPEYRLQSGYDEGFTDLLGVRPAWRGRGLASSLLAEAMRRFKAGGMAHAGLGVDTENASGALALYQRMGYTPTIRSRAWDFPLG
ncbi:GNAT family N-acetyltransferase [Arthrobacter sp. I2-34]|uniref:GNAT family N-acetyltransferase n=1 Tax=Arthrobacter hankyongi TaxID=2904801 RepID=A0ABS9LC57_9MICC|nr:GNAT family N-acetyltransferase [Arthrobacter hankyongi]MCG2624186.1 GNAT family N-acetyltransferase [Arthrobacter hankyongi]